MEVASYKDYRNVFYKLAGNVPTTDLLKKINDYSFMQKVEDKLYGWEPGLFMSDYEYRVFICKNDKMQERIKEELKSKLMITED